MFNREAYGKRESTAKKALAVVVLLISVIVVLISGIPIASRNYVEGQLQGLSQQLTEHTKGMPTGEASLTYDVVQIPRFGIGGKAVVINPSLRIVNKGLTGEDVTTVTSPRAEISVDRGGVLTVTLPEPLTVASNGKDHLRVTYETPPVYVTRAARTTDGAAAQDHHLMFPAKMTLVPLAANDAEPDAGPVVISLAPGGTLSVRSLGANGAGESALMLNNIQISEAGSGSSLAFGAITANAKVTPGEGTQAFDNSITLSDIGIKSGESQEGPYTVKLSFAGSRSLAQDAASTPDALVKEFDVTIREASFTADKVKLALTGELHMKGDDSLPYGAGQLEVKNFPALREGTLLPEEFRPALLELANRLTGQDTSAMQDLTIPLSREKLGVVMIGQMTLQDVAALIFAQAMSGGHDHSHESIAPSEPVPETGIAPDQQQPAAPGADIPAPADAASAPAPSPAPETSAVPTGETPAAVVE